MCFPSPGKSCQQTQPGAPFAVSSCLGERETEARASFNVGPAYIHLAGVGLRPHPPPLPVLELPRLKAECCQVGQSGFPASFPIWLIVQDLCSKTRRAQRRSSPPALKSSAQLAGFPWQQWCVTKGQEDGGGWARTEEGIPGFSVTCGHEL